MASLNKVMLIGNLTRDPEVRYTPKGTPVTDIGLACNRTYTLDTGERKEDVTFIDITFWGRSAEVIGQYMKKGRPIFVEGRLQMDTWEDKNTGDKRSKLKVVGENFQFLGGRDEGGGGGGGGNFQGPPPEQQQQPAQQQQTDTAPPPAQNAPAAVDEEDDDIPF